MIGSCHNQPRVWGAGPGEADVQVAKAGCEVCPILDGCVDRFAARLRRAETPVVAGLVVGGLHGRDLVSAVRAAQKGAAA